jgi:hypothetical protein
MQTTVEEFEVEEVGAARTVRQTFARMILCTRFKGNVPAARPKPKARATCASIVAGRKEREEEEEEEEKQRRR